MIAFSKSGKNLRKGNNIYFLNILIFNLPAFWSLIWYSIINILVVTRIPGFDSLRETCLDCNYFNNSNYFTFKNFLQL